MSQSTAKSSAVSNVPRTIPMGHYPSVPPTYMYLVVMMDATRDLQLKTIQTGRLGHPAVSDPSPVSRMTLGRFAVVTATADENLREPPSYMPNKP